MASVKTIGRYALTLGIIAAGIAPGGCRPTTVPAQSPIPSSRFPVHQTGLIAAPELIETSGMACARREPDLLWMANDGGHAPVLFAVQSDGKDLGRVAVRGAANRDWEDLAGFEWEGRAYILIADVGDNRAVRDAVHIYVVAEPERRPTGDFPAQIDVAWQFAFRYADGPRDCEAVGVDIRSGTILLITKRTSPPQVYTLPLRPNAGTSVEAHRVGLVPGIPPPTARDLASHPRFGALFSQPTALDIQHDGLLAVVLTYKDAYLFARRAGENWGETLVRRPLVVTLPELRQKESACLTPDGRRLYVTTEKRPAPLLAVTLEPIP
ncbi:MAG: hypothetical protein QNI89_01895 [Desulfobacterales bacterium]|nr:hypothetical protein [Desulfobacterales bacterium]